MIIKYSTLASVEASASPDGVIPAPVWKGGRRSDLLMISVHQAAGEKLWKIIL